MQQENLEQFERHNHILPDQTIYEFDQEQHNNLLDQQPWQKDPNYFTKCKISINALIKMLIHACLGNKNEVMGLLQGRCDGNTFIIFDIIQLHAEASETAVTLTQESMAEFTQTLDCLEKVGRVQPLVGWYHSHPSYGCWLSGTDVATQELQQQAYQTFVAVVIDPVRTMTNQKVDIGAFRVYPRNYKPQQRTGGDILIPAQKIKDFGAHHEKYYSLEVTFFSNTIDHKITDQLWEKYWGIRLAQNSIYDSTYFSTGLCDLRDKCFISLDHQIQGQTQTAQNVLEQVELQKRKDTAKFIVEYAGAIMHECVKQQLFK